MNIDHKRLSVRWMRPREDMGAVKEIEGDSFDTSLGMHELVWTLQQEGVHAMVAEQDNTVVGFFVYQLMEKEIQVIDFAVGSDYRRKGVGTAMMQALISKLADNSRKELRLELRETNLVAQLFFRAQGFRAVEVRRKPYATLDEDMYVMQYKEKTTAIVSDMVSVVLG